MSTEKMGDILNVSVNRINAEVACQRRAMELRTMPLDRSTRELMQPQLDSALTLFELLDKHSKSLQNFLSREEALNARILRVRARSLNQARRIVAIREQLPEHLSTALDEMLVQREAAIERELANNVEQPHTGSEPVIETSAEPQLELKPQPDPEPVCEFPQLARVTDSELADCPQYVKGRLTVDKIARVVNKFNEFVCTKYVIADRTLRECRAGPDRERWQAFKDSECPETEGETFVTDLELRAFSDFKMDATARQTINVLRHIGRIKEVRGKKKARCFILK